MVQRLAVVGSVFRDAFRNPGLRRLELGYLAFYTAECAVWLALLVYGYEHGGAGSASLMAVVQLVPSVVLSPLLGAVADRKRPGRVLGFGYLAQALAMGSIVAAMATGAPVWVTFALAPLVCLAISATRPAQAALLPSVVRTPEELTAANVLTGWSEGAGSLLGPVVAGLLLAAGGPALAIMISALLALGAAALVMKIPGPVAAAASASITTQLSSNLRAAGSDPSTRVLLVMHAYYFSLVGALDLLCVVLALTVLHLGRGGAGYLTAALGLGIVLAASVTAFVVGRPRLAGTMMAGLLGSAVALAVLGVEPTVVGAYLLLMAVGFGGSVFDVTGRTLLQRAVPSDAVAGVFAVLEALSDAGTLVGILLVRVATAVGGYRAALIAPAALALILAAAFWRRLRAIDGAIHVPQVEVSLLRRLAIFAPLPAPSIEALARRLALERVPEGTVLMREGEPGDRFFALADGKVSVTRHGECLAELGRGEGFGEIALVRDVPRTATVTALTALLVYSLEKEPFVLTLTGHPAAAAQAQAVASDHLRSQHGDGGRQNPGATLPGDG